MNRLHVIRTYTGVRELMPGPEGSVADAWAGNVFSPQAPALRFPAPLTLMATCPSSPCPWPSGAVLSSHHPAALIGLVDIHLDRWVQVES